MSNETKWTLGEWQIVHESGFGIDVGVPCEDGIGYYQVCELEADHSGDSEVSETYANANLIAAAPDLYEAASRLFNLANHFTSNGLEWFTESEENCDALRAAESALAKARGES